MQFRLLAAACAALTLGSPSLAQNDSPADTLSRWGLIGTWSVDCSQPPSRQNAYSIYEVTGAGKAVLRRDFGSDLQGDRSEILDAQIAADGMLHLTIRFTSLNQTRTMAFVKVGEGSRAFVNRSPDGTYTVQDGRFVHNGAPTPTQFRCR